ncbi:MAG: hypothetical protein QXN57_03235 [Desulfurococcaceae archaeon]
MEQKMQSIIEIFEKLQPVEQVIIVRYLLQVLKERGVECGYCGKRTQKWIWIGSVVICAECYKTLKNIQ